jgi:threonine synthase
MFYFFFAYKELKKYNKPLVVSCPSGNFGNICAGIIAKKLGLPISHFVAATNANDTVPQFLLKWNLRGQTFHSNYFQCDGCGESK